MMGTIVHGWFENADRVAYRRESFEYWEDAVAYNESMMKLAMEYPDSSWRIEVVQRGGILRGFFIWLSVVKYKREYNRKTKIARGAKG